MTNTVPTFSTGGARATAASPAVVITPGLPATVRQGNLLIACMWEGNGVAPGTWTVNAPWNILTTIPATLCNMVVAYTYARATGNDVAPTFTNSGPSGNLLIAQIFQYANVRISAPLGNSASAAASSIAAVATAAIAASAANSLAILIAFTANTNGVWPPAVGGWTLDQDTGLTNAFNVASKTLTNIGDSTGAPSTSNDTYWAMINLEVLGDISPGVGTDWFNGLPVQTIDEANFVFVIHPFV